MRATTVEQQDGMGHRALLVAHPTTLRLRNGKNFEKSFKIH
jgi:hypothetical protein